MDYLVAHNFFSVTLLLIRISLSASDRIPVGIIDFCRNGIRYTVSTEVCPGGIRFLENTFQPDDDCICMHGIYLAPGAIYSTGSQAPSPILVSPTLDCREHYQGFFDISNKATASKSKLENSCERMNSYSRSLLERWFLVPLANPEHIDREAVAMWKASSDESMYSLEGFRLFVKDRMGNLRIPFEKNFTGMFVYYKGFRQNDSFGDIKTIQIGQYCINLGDDGDNALVYMTQSTNRFDNTSINYGCSRTSLMLNVNKVGINTKSQCGISFFCFPTPYSRILRYEELLIVNDRPLPRYDEIIPYFRKALKTGFSKMLALRLQKFDKIRDSSVSSLISAMKFLQMTIQVAQKSLANEKHKALLENILKVLIIGSGENLKFSSESESESIMSFIALCLDKATPVVLPVKKENGTQNATERVKSGNLFYYNGEGKYKKNFLIIDVIRTALEFARIQCITTLPDSVYMIRIFENIIQRIYLSPVFHEEFWFLETSYVHVLLPGLDEQFLQMLEELTNYARASKSNYDSGRIFQRKTWTHAEKLYQFNLRSKKPIPNATHICKGFVIWHGTACCLQVDSENELTPKMPEFTQFYNNGPTLCSL